MLVGLADQMNSSWTLNFEKFRNWNITDNFNTKILDRIDIEVDDSIYNIAESFLAVEESLGIEVKRKSKNVDLLFYINLLF